MGDKQYVGSGVEKEGKFGSFLKLSYSKADLELMLSKVNNKGYINLNCNKRKEVGKYGDTHSMTIDDWVPNTDQARQDMAPKVHEPQQPTNGGNADNNFDNFDESIPF